MDNYSLHISDDVVAVLTRVRVRIITFTTYTTYFFQILDIVLFGILKKHDTSLETLDDEQSVAQFLLKVYHDFKQTRVEANIWEAFAVIGFTYDIEKTPYGLLFDEEKFRQCRGFVELWERNTPSESLLK
jgi:hypothetical protein